jgi:hypothetical protein
LVKNPSGSPHIEAELASNQLPDEDLHGEQDAFNNKDELHRQLISGQRQTSNLPTEDEQFDEKELEQEYNGPIHYTTKCKLVCSVCTVSGTLSITANELYFEVNEDDETYKSLDAGVSFIFIKMCFVFVSVRLTISLSNNVKLALLRVYTRYFVINL